jgi:hypothetical protein
MLRSMAVAPGRCGSCKLFGAVHASWRPPPFALLNARPGHVRGNPLMACLSATACKTTLSHLQWRRRSRLVHSCWQTLVASDSTARLYKCSVPRSAPSVLPISRLQQYWDATLTINAAMQHSISYNVPAGVGSWPIGDAACLHACG